MRSAISVSPASRHTVAIRSSWVEHRRAVLSQVATDSIRGMRQILLRVPDDVHRRLAARAARDGRSVNAVATEILDAAVDADEGDRRGRLRSRAATLGVLRAVPASSVSAARRRRIVASTRGIGPIADLLMDAERDPR